MSGLGWSPTGRQRGQTCIEEFNVGSKRHLTHLAWNDAVDALAVNPPDGTLANDAFAASESAIRMSPMGRQRYDRPGRFRAAPGQVQTCELVRFRQLDARVRISMPDHRHAWARRLLLTGLVVGALPALCALSWCLLYLYLGASYVRHGDSEAFVDILTREE